MTRTVVNRVGALAALAYGFRLQYFDRVRIYQRLQPGTLQPWMLISAAWVLPAGFAVINRIAQTHLSGWTPATMRDLLWESGDWFIYAFLTPAVFAVSKRLPLSRTQLKGGLARRALAHLWISLLFCAAWATLGQLLRWALTLLFEPKATLAAMRAAQFYRAAGVEWLGWIFTTLPFGVAVYLCVVGVEHAIRYFVEARERDVQLARLSEQLSSARFAALQAQVNPHFLFNTLNTIAVFVRDNDRQAAIRVIEQLSEVLRTTLSSHRMNEVPLGEELDLVRRYVAIEEARFSDRLRPEFDVDDSLLSAATPSFALQHLVENAIRHGIAKRPDAGRLAVIARRDGAMLELSVIDDGIGVDAEFVMPQGHGVENTRERLRALYGERASLEIAGRPEGGAIARLRTPYREMTPE
ncbi:MAG TPA: histidine kinase [Blastocatellia bacterium]